MRIDRTFSTPDLFYESSVSPGAQAIINDVMDRMATSCAERSFAVKLPLAGRQWSAGSDENKDLLEAGVRLAENWVVKIFGDREQGGYLLVAFPGYHDFNGVGSMKP